MHSLVISESSEPTTVLDTRWVSTKVNWTMQITPNPSCHWEEPNTMRWAAEEPELDSCSRAWAPGSVYCRVGFVVDSQLTRKWKYQVKVMVSDLFFFFFSLSSEFPWISSFYRYEIEEENNMNLLESLPWDSFFSHLHVKNNKSLVWRPKSPFPGPVNPVIFLGLILPLIKDVS